MREKMKTTELEQMISADGVSKRNGIFTIRRGYYYTGGYDADKYKENIENQLIENDIRFEYVDHGNVWLPFKGGAPLAKQSHWFVKVRITD